jgi:hypothetical protein
MRKQTLILTTWLALPFICLTLIMVWIFVSLDKDRLMDEPPVGAGAGDTGNANALGQYLAGRDADQISKANDARREGIEIDPLQWPGGVVIRIPQNAISFNSESGVTIFVTQSKTSPGLFTSMALDDAGYYSVKFVDTEFLGPQFYVGSGIRRSSINPDSITDAKNRELRMLLLPNVIPDPNLQVNDPIVVTLEIDSVYQASTP